MKKETRGRKPLPYKSHSCYVRIPHDIYKRMEESRKDNGWNISQFLLESVKFFLGIK